MTAAERSAHAWIEDNATSLSSWHRTIWEFAEPAWREYRSAAWYVELLRREGFTVEEASGGMPTAFNATWSNGEGPTLLTYAEYDAVPGNCQAADTKPAPRGDLPIVAPGHTDPHSALGISTLGAVLATKQAMEQHGLRGTLRFTGEPAEKVQGSKVVHGLRGYYDDVDAIISFHPFYMLPLCNTVRWDTHCGAYHSRVYTFRCDRPEEWASSAAASPIPASHSSVRAPGANLALATMLTLTKSTQDSMLPHSGSWSLNEAILTAGNATADNLPAPVARIQYSWRTADIESAESILTVLDRNAELAASAAGCSIEPVWVSRTRPGIANHVMAKTTYRSLERVGAPWWGRVAIGKAQEMLRNAGREPLDAPFLAASEHLVDPRAAERELRISLPEWQRNWTSDDYVEMTHYAPTARLYIARPMLAPVLGDAPYPAWIANALGGIAETIDPTIMVAAKTIAGAFVELLEQPTRLAEARHEFDRRRESAGHPTPLLAADFDPPIDLPWPEYVTTARGHGWSA